MSKDAVPSNSTTILRCTVGSTIHGTNVAAQDDRDEMAIVVEPIEYRLGLKQWDTYSERTAPEGQRSGPGDLDLVTHTLNKFARLAASGNPTILIPLYTPAAGLVTTTTLGNQLRDKRQMFLSRLVGKAFLGYMKQQRMRMTGEVGSKHGVARPELVRQYGFDTKYAGHVIRLGLQGIELMEHGVMSLPMRDDERQMVLDIRTGGWTFEQVLRKAVELEQHLLIAMNTSKLSMYPNYEEIDKFLIKAYLQAWAVLWHRLK